MSCYFFATARVMCMRQGNLEVRVGRRYPGFDSSEAAEGGQRVGSLLPFSVHSGRQGEGRTGPRHEVPLFQAFLFACEATSSHICHVINSATGSLFFTAAPSRLGSPVSRESVYLHSGFSASSAKNGVGREVEESLKTGFPDLELVSWVGMLWQRRSCRIMC